MSTTSKASPVLAVMSTLAALQVLVGGAALGDVVGVKVAGLLVLAVAALQTGLQFYVRGTVTPWSDVVAQQLDDGRVVAGPAHPAKTGQELQAPASAPDAA